MSKAALFSRQELEVSLNRVKAKSGLSDNYSLAQEDHQDVNQILEQLNSGYYTPDPVRQYVRIKAGSRKEQKIGLLSPRDKIVQQLLVNKLSPIFEKDFLDCSYAYRRGRSAIMAAEKVESLLREGNMWVLETDIDSFFQSLDHGLLISLLKEKIKEERIIDLISAYLTAPHFHEMTFHSAEEGVNIGGVISPLLSNIYLHPLDCEMVKGGYIYVRYSDDLVVLGTSKEEMRQALFFITKTLQNLKLQLNRSKTHIRHVSEGFDFLGFRFDHHGKGPAVKAIEALEHNITIIKDKNNLPAVAVNELYVTLEGWCNYFGSLSWMVPQDQVLLTALVKVAVAHQDTKWAEQLLHHRMNVELTEPLLCNYLADGWDSFGWDDEVLLELGKALLLDTKDLEVRKSLAELLKMDTASLEQIINQLLLITAEPQFAPGYQVLTELLTQHGLFKYARAVHARAVAMESNASTDSFHDEQTAYGETVKHEVSLNANDIEKFLDLFAGREDCYAYEVPGPERERVFKDVKTALTSAEVKRHLEGEITLSTCLMRENNTVRLMAIDIDISKKLLLQYAQQPAEIEALLQLTQTDANRLKSSGNDLGFEVYIEDSGYRGRHCWLFFEEPVSAKNARILAGAMMRKAGPPAAGITREIFPGADRHKVNHQLQRLKLPFGIHPKSGLRGLFVDETGTPHLDQASVLHLVEPVSRCLLEEIVAVEEKSNQEKSEPRIEDYAEMQESAVLLKETESILVKAVIQNCAVIKHLVCKAEITRYLPHADRQVLLYVLAHLGEEGKTFLHRVMAYCMNYNKKITAKHIARVPDKPISCIRIRERYPQLSASLNCSCRFKRAADTYPSPVLHAIARGVKGVKEIKMPLSENVIPESIIGDQVEEVEKILKKMQNLRRQKQGIENSLAKCEQLLETYFKERGLESLTVEAGSLKRIRDEHGNTRWVIEI